TRGDLLIKNWQAALTDSSSNAASGPLFVGGGAAPCGVNPSGQPWVSAALVNFFRTSGMNPAIAAALIGTPAQGCLQEALGVLQDSFFPSLERSNSLFDQRHRFVFSGVYQTGKLSREGFARRLLSNWTVAPLIEFASGRPFNIITGNPDNFQFSPSTGRPNVVPAGAPATPCGPTIASKFSPTGSFQEPCFAVFAAGGSPSLLALDGNFPRNGGLKPWTVFNDLRVARRINFGERIG